ncbi:MAG: CoA transferase [Caldilineaceae bacterium]|nr:CoA transferase [Caldilineaceae bacterium]
MSAAALSDVTVLDLSRVLAGPYGTMILGDLGADVIKIEQPGLGDDTRRWGPPFTDSGQSAYFLSANRNKQSVTLNLKDERGKAILRRLVQQADVLIENFKVGTMARLGLGYDDLRQINPGLIYCAITGYGQSGPYHERPGYDTVIQAQGGVMSITGPAEDEPFKVGVAIVDVTAGMHAVISILAALHHRARSGQGQFIDIALFDAQLGWLVNVAGSYLVSGESPARYGNAHATIVPYQTFATADGHLMLAVGNDRQFASLCGVLGKPAWIEDARFVTNPARVAHRAALIPLLAAEFAQAPTHVWIERLLDVDVPCGPVNDVPTALSDPQAEARAMVQSVVDSQGETIRLVGPVAKMTETPLQVVSAPPYLGEHTEAVLRKRLGMSVEEIGVLRGDGVV